MIEKLLFAIFVYIMTAGSAIIIAIFGIRKKLDDIFDLIEDDILDRRMKWR